MIEILVGLVAALLVFVTAILLQRIERLERQVRYLSNRIPY